MATSGSTNFEQTRDELIVDALRKINVLGSSESVGADDLSLCVRQLNRLVKSWQLDGIYSWNQEEGVVFLTDGQAQYSLGESGDRSCLLSDLVETTISADEASGQTVLSVTSTTGMAASDVIGIVLDDETMHWTTISSLTSTTVTVASALTAAAESGNKVYAYTTLLTRPLRILYMTRYDGTTDIEMQLISDQQYRMLPTKSSTGTPLMATYKDNRRDTGKLVTWPVVDNATTLLKFTFIKPLEDFDSGTNNPDFPVAWYDALVYNLAVRVAPDFGVKPNDIAGVIQMADYLYRQIRSNTQEWEPVCMSPEAPDVL